MKRLLSVLICLAAVFGGGGSTAPAYADKPLQVTVSIEPQKYFVEKIGGNLVEVEVMVPPGAAVERYEPKPRQMVALAESRLYFAIGVPFEDAWLEKMAAANPKLRVVHTEAGIEKRMMEAHAHEGEGGGRDQASSEETSHGHGIKDPHIWLSPPLVMLQARHILTGLLEADPVHKDSYEANYRNFIAELAELDTTLIDTFRAKGEVLQFMVFHPAWGYFAEAYGLKQIPVEIEGKEPKAQELEQLITLAKAQRIQAVFVQPQFSTRSAQVIADAIGGRVVVADPLAGDWAKNLRDVAQSFAAAMK